MDALTRWAAELQAADTELRQRHDQAVAQDLAPEDLDALAAERAKISTAWDSLATARDEQASGRDMDADERDMQSVRRDRRADDDDDDDRGFAQRFLAARDADDAAGDRAASVADRASALGARERAAEDRADREDGRIDAATAAAAADKLAAELRRAIETRTVIGQAEGMLMARYGIPAERAFAVLVRLSQASNVKLHTVAEELVASATGSFIVEQASSP